MYKIYFKIVVENKIHSVNKKYWRGKKIQMHLNNFLPKPQKYSQRKIFQKPRKTLTFSSRKNISYYKIHRIIKLYKHVSFFSFFLFFPSYFYLFLRFPSTSFFFLTAGLLKNQVKLHTRIFFLFFFFYKKVRLPLKKGVLVRKLFTLESSILKNSKANRTVKSFMFYSLRIIKLF